MKPTVFAEFLLALQQHGRVHVANEDAARTDDPSARSVLIQMEAAYRDSLTDEVPAFDLEVGMWGAMSFYRACQCFAFRDISERVLAEALNCVCPTSIPAPELAYAVDLTWRFLPDLWRLSVGRSAQDPLVSALKQWAAAWPLSSVGLPVERIELQDILQNCCLRTLYVDRVIARRDTSRLADPQVREFVQAALGAHSELAPGFGTNHCF